MDAQRNLLFGVLALQEGFVSEQQLVAALHVWLANKSRPLGRVLREQGAVRGDGNARVAALVEKHLAQHQHQPERALAALSVVESIRSQLVQIADADLAAAAQNLSLAACATQSVMTIVPDPSAAPPGQEVTLDWNRAADGTSEDPGEANLRFRILRQHAKGGLGEVFLAEDRELHREVALKEIQARHAAHADSRARFVLEAEITGGLEHPGIVPIYGMGSYADGRPYYAMRFIRGDSLEEAIKRYHETDWTQRSHSALVLERRQLLARFIAVCNAIEYAHNRGVLHRDLKPANIMLGKYGETLVVDWGLAKTLGQSEPAETRQERPLHPFSADAVAGTQMGATVGTPNYMSPEQAAGALDRMGPESDVYSLGATLYQLLTGRVPFEGRNIGQILQQVISGTFPPPRQVDRHVPKPLEAICLRAMALDPAARYPSADALAKDVERWMADEATLAYREPWRERLLRWARRHKTWTQAAAMTVSTIAITAIVASALINRSRQNEAVARQSAEKSFMQARQTVDDFFTRVSENRLLDVPALQPLRRDLLEAALHYYQQFIVQRDNDPTVRAELAETYYRVGLITGEIGSKTDALSSLEHAYTLQDSLVADDPGSISLGQSLANTGNAIGNIKQQIGDLKNALARFKDAAAVRESLAKRAPNDAQLRRKLANSHNNIGVVYARLGKHKDAGREFETAGAMRAELAQQNRTPQFIRDLAQGHFNFSLYQREIGKLTGSEESLRKAIEQFEILVEMEPRSIDYRRELARACRGLGDLQAETGNPAESLESYERARVTAEELARQNPVLLELQADVAAIYGNLGRLKHETAKLPHAVEWYARSRTIREQLVSANPAVDRYQMDLASCDLHLGMAQLDIDSLGEALASFESALKGYQAVARKNPRGAAVQDALGQTYRNIGLVYRAQNDHAKAVEAFEETRATYERLAEDPSASPAVRAGLGDALVNIAVDRRALEQFDAAQTAAQRAVEIQAALVFEEPKVAEYRYMQAEGLYMLGLLQLRQQAYAEALESYRSAVEIVTRLVGENGDNLKYRSMLGSALDKQSVAMWMLEMRDAAIESADSAAVELMSAFTGSPKVVQYRLNLSDNYFNRAKFHRGQGNVAQAVELTKERSKLWPESAPELYRVACEYALSAEALDKQTERRTGEQQDQQRVYMTAAIRSLKLAIAAGLEDLHAIHTDPQLQILRRHPDFRKVLKPGANKGK